MTFGGRKTWACYHFRETKGWIKKTETKRRGGKRRGEERHEEPDEVRI